MIITIDGPAGAGKSSVAKGLARRLNFEFLDTGAMYRAVTWAVLQQNVNPNNGQAVAAIASRLKIRLADDQTFVNEQNVSDEIRSGEVTAAVSSVADNVAVRWLLVQQQREISASGNFVCEGRDQGTEVFPNAECKIFLTASSAQRAQRRLKQLQSTDPLLTFENIHQQQINRDQRDQQRPVGALRQAEDALEVNTDGLNVDQVINQLEEIARKKLCLA